MTKNAPTIFKFAVFNITHDAPVNIADPATQQIYIWIAIDMICESDRHTDGEWEQTIKITTIFIVSLEPHNLFFCDVWFSFSTKVFGLSFAGHHVRHWWVATANISARRLLTSYLISLLGTIFGALSASLHWLICCI